MASTKAKRRLEVLSTKSFESPERVVLKSSLSTLSAILSISSIPSPRVYLPSRPADIVAELNLLYLYKLGRKAVLPYSNNIIKLDKLTLVIPDINVCEVRGIISFRPVKLAQYLILFAVKDIITYTLFTHGQLQGLCNALDIYAHH